MGVLCVQSVEKNAYRRVHLDMLQTLAAHAAVALDNARAYRQLEEMEKQVRLQHRRAGAGQPRLAGQRRAAAPGQAEGRGRDAPEVRIPGQHEPRDAHPAGRRDRHARLRAARRQAARRHPRADPARPGQRPVAAGDHQRPARFFQDRGRQADHREHRLRARRHARKRGQPVRGAGRRAQRRLRHRPGARPAALRGGRPDPAAPGAGQPGRQRLQVHQPRQRQRAGRAAAGRSGRSRRST